MAYSKALAKKYAANRNRYRSSDIFLDKLLKKTGVKGKAILDFGCGDGPEAERFAKIGAKEVVGVDPSAEMIRLARTKKIDKARFIRNDGKNLPLKNGSFDLAYSRFVLHYIKNLKPPFIEIARVLKPGGYLIAIFQCLTNDPKLLNKQVPITLGTGKFATQITILSKSTDEIKSALTKAGLDVVKLTKVKNADSSIDPKYKNKYGFKNLTYILLAKKPSVDI